MPRSPITIQSSPRPSPEPSTSYRSSNRSGPGGSNAADVDSASRNSKKRKRAASEESVASTSAAGTRGSRTRDPSGRLTSGSQSTSNRPTSPSRNRASIDIMNRRASMNVNVFAQALGLGDEETSTRRRRGSSRIDNRGREQGAAARGHGEDGRRNARAAVADGSGAGEDVEQEDGDDDEDIDSDGPTVAASIKPSTSTARLSTAPSKPFSSRDVSKPSSPYISSRSRLSSRPLGSKRKEFLSGSAANESRRRGLDEPEAHDSAEDNQLRETLFPEVSITKTINKGKAKAIAEIELSSSDSEEDHAEKLVRRTRRGSSVRHASRSANEHGDKSKREETARRSGSTAISRSSSQGQRVPSRTSSRGPASETGSARGRDLAPDSPAKRVKRSESSRPATRPKKNEAGYTSDELPMPPTQPLPSRPHDQKVIRHKRVREIARSASPDSSSSGAASRRAKPSTSSQRDSDKPASDRSSWSGNQDPLSPGRLAKEKRLASQLNATKQKLHDMHGQFDELSDAFALKQRSYQELEEQLAHMKRAHQEELKNLLRQHEGLSTQPPPSQSQGEQTSSETLNLRKENDRLVLEARQEIDLLRREHNELLQLRDHEVHSLRRETIQLHERFDEEREAMKKDHQTQMQQLEERMTNMQNTVRLEAKERAMESFNFAHRMEVDTLKAKLQEADHQIRTLSQAAKAHEYMAFTNGAPSAGEAPPNDYIQLQRKVSTLEQERLYQRSMIEALQAKLVKRDGQLAASQEWAHNKVEGLEVSRTKLEWQIERMRNEKFRAVQERDVLLKECQASRKLLPEAKRLEAEYPIVVAQNKKLSDAKEALLKENTQMRSERGIYINQLESARQESQGLLIELESLKNKWQSHQARCGRIAVDRKDLRSKLKRKVKDFGSVIEFVRPRLSADDAKHLEALQAASNISSDSSGSESQDDVASVAHLSINGHSAPSRQTRRSSSRSIDDFDPLFDDVAPHEQARDPTPDPSTLHASLKVALQEAKAREAEKLQTYEASKPVYHFPELTRERREETRVPKHRSRVYLRSQCHTPYVPDEVVSDSDDEFLDWELEAYARSQASNPDQKAATVNVCWNRHILDVRTTRHRYSNLQFVNDFVRLYASLIKARDAGQALLMHVLELVRLGQLSSDEGSVVMKTYHMYAQS